MYRLVASSLTGKPAGSVEPAERALAKTCCLGVIYGMGSKELAKRFKLSEAAAARFVAGFFARFPKVQQWAAAVRAAVHADGFVTTIAQRRREVWRPASTPRVSNTHTHTQARAHFCGLKRAGSTGASNRTMRVPNDVLDAA